MATGVGLELMVCGPEGASGVTYATSSGSPVECGTDASGNALALQVSTALVAVDPASATPTIDPSEIAGFWAAAFMPVLLLHFASRGIGAIVNFIRGLD